MIEGGRERSRNCLANLTGADSDGTDRFKVEAQYTANHVANG
jgi:hypothetical protein